MKTFVFIGSIQWGQQSTGGGVQTKNQHLLRYVMSKGMRCTFYDTFGKSRLSALTGAIFYIIKAKKNSVVLISVAYKGTYALGKICKFLGIKRRLVYLVPGGDFTDFVKEGGRTKVDVFSRFESIYLQAEYLKKDLESLGLRNSKVLSNFKPIIFHPPLEKKRGKPFRFFFLSRIKKDKGVKEIIEAVKLLERDDITVDFYGKIIEPYTEEIFSGLERYNIQYKGFLDLSTEEGYKTLSNYDAFLFPTYFVGEGFPGVLIDSFIAGVPAIATDFHANGEIIKDGQNGILIPIKDVNALAKAMNRLIEDTICYNWIRRGAIDSANKFEIDHVLKEFFSNLELEQF